ncbi:tRNA uracil 4-sulfurtransferase ThiI [Bacillus alkalicellulosilyticus]|uniref:tRNA uracil 4-sulfurtransferase ThiI n=1 Tax=Alkalihalobacterium alkalicellulosilyticum TaxID=1912214 RepID=UPI0009969E09|nr:tRNA uracil 4-sulfurtransferase ThiI [Bacillus alkalicellulosilyticus]
MIYDHILIRYGELALKGKNRTEFEKTLKSNIKQVIKPFSQCKIERTFGRMMIELNGEPVEPIIEKLSHVFGIHSFSVAMKVENDLEAIKAAALQAIKDKEDVKTFKVSSRRAFKTFPIESQKLNHYIGSHILINTDGITVDVHKPDVEVKVEVRETATYITCGNIPGAGGLPVGTGGKVMLMLSGGIDSPVAGYLAMKRGLKINAIHFHSPPFTNERAKQKVMDLTKILTQFGGTIHLHLVPFTELQKAIHEKIPSNFAMTIMRRMMLRISERIATEQKSLGITTGESLGQVASQTLHSMNTINEVTNLPVIRPLVTMDKLEVIQIAEKIGTYETSILPFEDCCTIFLPPQSKTRPKREHANKYEANFDYESYIEEALQQTEVVKITASERVNDTELDDLL